MLHMLSCFNLKHGETIETFRQRYRAFVEEMQKLDLVVSTDPIGRRQNDTPMDTDEERNHAYFVVMNFRDRAQVDAAYDHIEQHFGPGDAAHNQVYTRVQDPVFICWQDLP